MTLRSTLTATFWVAVTQTFFFVSTHAQNAQIVDSRPLGAIATESQVASRQQTAELFHQLQLLQEEVQSLRGLVEEQNFEIKKLKQQRLDDYVDLDRRLGALAKGRGSGVKRSSDSGTRSGNGTIETSTLPSAVRAPDELSTYRSAVDLLLKRKDFDAGADALHNYLKQFPDGEYTANAQYWLGETYLAKGSLDESKLWFDILLSESPDHAKALDAKYKLGQVLHKQGDLEGAKAALTQAASCESTTAKLAKNYLNRHFK